MSSGITVSGCAPTDVFSQRPGFVRRSAKPAFICEFSEYLSWVARWFPNLCFGRHVEDMHYREGQLIVRIQLNFEICSKHIVVGFGRRHCGLHKSKFRAEK